LRRRRDARVRPFTVISCDNLPENGKRLRRAVLQLAGEIKPDLAHWIEGEVRFPGTMVDSITPATDDGLRSGVAEILGVRDQWPVQRESFQQWVMEDDLGTDGPNWRSVGVTLTNDVEGFEFAKLRLLNGAHSCLAYLGLLRGHTTVYEAIMDASLANFVGDLMVKDMVPTLAAPPGVDLEDYSRAIFRRFRNPEIRHNLAQIAWDGSLKLPIRILAPINDAVRAGRPIGRLCVPIAAWMQFVRKASIDGRRIVDPLAGRLTSIGAGCENKAKIDVSHFLAIEPMFGALARNLAFVQAVEVAYTILGGEQEIERAFEVGALTQPYHPAPGAG
jgi:fructuronate reductase